ncbi:unnamed protein product [Rhizoctonia solani]|uniref:BTB domain-containing protein n=1 Tax=Rhizoctonia solani TaxID=456999 RepID=A0A8H2WVH1_9AGAM|nr:unnamed protein product [Rhizoctonia solani]
MESSINTSFSLSDDSGNHALNTNPKPNICAPPESEGIPLFEPGDGDIHISVNGKLFETHKYLIKRFRGLKTLLNEKPFQINVQRDDVSAEDFAEMFKVLYASIITGPFEFTPNALVSTLRIATIYEHLALREYCIRYLETLELDAVKRIEIAREFHLPEWEEPAYHELGARDEPITREEAKIIGLDAFVCIAEMREKEQRRRRDEVDAIAQDRMVRDQPQEDTPTGGTAQANDANDDANLPLGTNHEAGVSLAGVNLNSVNKYNWIYGHIVPIPSCKCGAPNQKCEMPSCTVLVLKGLQAQQQAYANRIFDLESSVKKLNTSVTAKYAPTISKTRTSTLKLAPEEPPTV